MSANLHEETSVTHLSVDIGKLSHADKFSEIRPLDDAFIEEHRPMIEGIASQIMAKGSAPSVIEFGDLVSFGMEGLMKAHRNFKPDKGSAFKTYAYYRIRGEMYDRIRTEWQYRNPGDYADYRRRIQDRIADVVEEAITDLDASPAQGDVEGRFLDLLSDSAMVCLMSIDVVGDIEGAKDVAMEAVDNTDDTLWEEIKLLDADEQQFVDLFYIKGIKQKDIADQMNQSRSKICRLHMRILEKLRKRLKKRMVDA
jgi:RNA polymerase sigma factor for flagellar operon FliA